ncbi:MAG: FAD-dependent oxidoreductase [Dehalococcoidales bacterium]|nr:FAD-dependent oxidoreductase [Dehalococcoidales bacterium]
MRLFEPSRIGGLLIKNRIVMAPMDIGGLAEPDGRLSQRAIDYYVARARGGVGLIITGATGVSRELGLNSTILTADSAIHISRLSELADAIHDYGAKVAVQLTAGFGRVAESQELKKGKPVAPSASPCFWDPGITARQLSIEEIEHLVQAFETSAEIVSSAGIDAIELHGHEGYLLDQFMTALWNRRTDKYGGDLAGRLRFPLEAIEAVKRGAGADFPVIYRFGLKHYIKGGRVIEEGLEIARRLEAAGVDALDIDAGCHESWYWPHPSTYQPPGCMVDMAEMAKKVVGIPVITVGNLGYPELAERILQEGKADFVALGRALLADPDWPNKVEKGRLEDIRPCIADREGCLSRILSGKYVSCTVNPATGMEREFALKPAERKKSVLVVGGGPGGMEAARVAALRGHRVTLWEKANALGGNLIPASAPDFKQGYRNLIGYLSTQIKKLGVDIVLRREATLELIQDVKPDVVFIATGSSPLIPEIRGIEKRNVVTAIDALLGKREVGRTVVVVGGGLVGCEIALHLAQKGKELTIVEILGSPARNMGEPDRMHLLKLLADINVRILLETRVSEIMDDGLVIVDKYGKQNKLSSDTVVLATGLKPNSRLEALKGKVPEIYAIGDCVEPRKVINAIWEGFRIARLI